MDAYYSKYGSVPCFPSLHPMSVFVETVGACPNLQQLMCLFVRYLIQIVLPVHVHFHLQLLHFK